MRVRFRTERLSLDIPFTISRGTTVEQEVLIAEIEHAGLTGYGEASPSAYYGDSLRAAAAVINRAEPLLRAADIGGDPFALELIRRRLERDFPGSPSGRAAVEIAAHDLAAKMAGVPLYKMLGLAGLKPPPTSFTVGVKDPDLLKGGMEKLRSFPVLKVKLGFGREEYLLKMLRDETGALLRADVNEGWDVAAAREKMPRYREEYRIEFFEQPLPRTDLDGYRILMEETGCTVIVDESVTGKSDVFRWAGLAHGVNLKVMKSGGIRPVIEMVAAARAAGLKVMLGCMVESSVGISAAAHVAPLVDYCDLDGNLLIDNDPFEGVRGVAGRLELADRPGLGVRPRA